MPEILPPSDGAARQAAELRDITRRLAALETARNVPAVLAPIIDTATFGTVDTVRVVRFRIPPGGHDSFYVAFAWDRGDSDVTEAWLECLGEQSSRVQLADDTGTMAFAWCRPDDKTWPEGVLTLDDDGRQAAMTLFVQDTGNTSGNQTILSQIHAVWLRCDSHPTLGADDRGAPRLSPFVP
jgi:hypothetical protein